MSSNPPLPPGWQSAIDPTSGRLYYANATTGESSWEIPRLPPPPPPPSLPPIRPPPQLPPALPGSNQSLFRPPMHQQQTQRHQMSRSLLEEREQRFIPPQPLNTTTTTTTNMPPPSASTIRALASTGSLVAAARGVVEARTVAPDSNKRIELHGLTTGQLVDLLQLQTEQITNDDDDASNEPYLPVNPYNIPEGAKAMPMEAARLDIRLHSLYEKLKKIKQ